MSTMTSGQPPKFQTGERVRVDNRPAKGHCRAPVFIKGQIGTVVTLHGTFRDPERLAYHQPGLPAQKLYKVRFKQTDLWPNYTGNQADQLEVDVYENWLSPVTS